MHLPFEIVVGHLEHSSLTITIIQLMRAVVPLGHLAAAIERRLAFFPTVSAKNHRIAHFWASQRPKGIGMLTIAKMIVLGLK